MLSDIEVKQTQTLFRLEMCYAATAEYPEHISVQCGFQSCDLYVDAPHPQAVIAIPIKGESLNDYREAWNAAIGEATNHFIGHQIRDTSRC